jgi:hypothetical protein
MRQLIIGGDSFTLGSELQGKSWAELLGDKLGYKNINTSIAGAGNAAITRAVINALLLEDCAVAVMWTFLARFDHYITNKWHTTTVHDTTDFGKSFFKHVGNSEYYELHNSLTNILLLQNTLEKYNIPYVFTSADHEWHSMHFANDPWIEKLLTLIDWNKWYSIDCGNGFYKWGKSNYLCGKFGHPLDEAHKDLSDNIFQFTKNLVGFSN